MSKKDKKQVPYIVNMEINLEGLASLPAEMTAEKLFTDACIGAVIRVSKQTNGLSMQEQRRLYSLRETFVQAMEVKETKEVKVEEEDFKFLWKMWNDQRPEATVNELIMRVEVKLKDARSWHDKGANKIEG